jgi:hypothetical protein
MFRLFLINDHDINKKTEINFHLTKNKEKKGFVKSPPPNHAIPGNRLVPLRCHDAGPERIILLYRRMRFYLELGCTTVFLGFRS